MRDQIANIRLIIEKSREFQKNICFIDYAKAFDCGSQKIVGNSQRNGMPKHVQTTAKLDSSHMLAK